MKCIFVFDDFSKNLWIVLGEKIEKIKYSDIEQNEEALVGLINQGVVMAVPTEVEKQDLVKILLDRKHSDGSPLEKMLSLDKVRKIKD